MALFLPGGKMACNPNRYHWQYSATIDHHHKQLHTWVSSRNWVRLHRVRLSRKRFEQFYSTSNIYYRVVDYQYQYWPFSFLHPWVFLDDRLEIPGSVIAVVQLSSVGFRSLSSFGFDSLPLVGFYWGNKLYRF